MKYVVDGESRYEFNLYSENTVEKVSDKEAREIGNDNYDDEQGTQWGSNVCDTIEDLIMYLRQEKAHYMNFTVNLDQLPDDEQMIIIKSLSLWDIPNSKEMVEAMVSFYRSPENCNAVFSEEMMKGGQS